MNTKILYIILFVILGLQYSNAQFSNKESWDKVRKDCKKQSEDRLILFVKRLDMDEKSAQNIPQDIKDKYIPVNYVVSRKVLYGYHINFVSDIEFILNIKALNLSWQEVKNRLFSKENIFLDENLWLIAEANRKLVRENYALFKDYKKTFDSIDEALYYIYIFGQLGKDDIRKNINGLIPAINSWKDLNKYMKYFDKFAFDLISQHFADTKIYDMKELRTFKKYFPHDLKNYNKLYDKFYNENISKNLNKYNELPNNVLNPQFSTFEQIANALDEPENKQNINDAKSFIADFSEKDPKNVLAKIKPVLILDSINTLAKTIEKLGDRAYLDHTPSLMDLFLHRNSAEVGSINRAIYNPINNGILYIKNNIYEINVPEKIRKIAINKIDKITERHGELYYNAQMTIEAEVKSVRKKEERLQVINCNKCEVDYDNCRFPRTENDWLGYVEKPGIIKMKNGSEYEFYWDKKEQKWYIDDGILFSHRKHFNSFEELILETIQKCKSYFCK